LLLLSFVCGLIYNVYQVYRISDDVNTHKAVDLNEWILTLPSSQWNVYSQSGEDGVIDAIFKKIGTTNKIYEEFGVEDCMVQCNTKHLRETGWDYQNSLLMDGGHSNPDINLQQVIFWPNNIVKHFQKFGVKKEFDLLSVDTDSYDWFIIEAILEAGYKPRVLVTEVNVGFDLEDSKSILPPADGKSYERWDGTAYHGTSILSLYYLFNRFQYSLLMCNYINCFAVRDDALGAYIRRPYEDIFLTHPTRKGCDFANRSMAVIDPNGRWMGATDEGQGSPMIRYVGCEPPVDWRPYIDDIPQATVEPEK